MRRYKPLQSFAHGLAHSFTSSHNSVEGESPFDQVKTLAWQAKLRLVRLDILNGIVDPAELQTQLLENSAALYRIRLGDMLGSEGWSLSDLQAAEVVVDFHVFECRAYLTDDCGKVYEGVCHLLPRKRHV
jgi:hypothetical protein